MCGIAGIIDYSGGMALSESVQAMVQSLAHRGPDGRGQFVRDKVALGHARLSIIDLAGGAQPMSSGDGAVHISYNGEIYNFRELRKQLQLKGHFFRTESDTEVILQAYRQWGKRCVDHLEGMFAFAIADFDQGEVFLARDPFGIKPLLYRIHQNSFAFASEFQALWRLPDWTGEIELQSIDSYLRLQYIPAPATAFHNVFKLPAAHCITVRMDRPHHKIERYWTPDFSRKKSISDGELIELLDDALRDSVRRHLVSDVPFGALLSGGVDSSLVVGYMAEMLEQPVKTFSIGFEEKGVNELPFARRVAEKYGTDHHEEIVRFDALEILPELVRHHGEPFGDQSAIPTWYLSKLARNEVPMVLSGDGGDELFAGYHAYGSWLRKMRHARPAANDGWKRHLHPLARRIFPPSNAPRDQPMVGMAQWGDCVTKLDARQREGLWRPELGFVSDPGCYPFEVAFSGGRPSDNVNRVQRADLETFLPQDILCKVDIASMCHGLEVRPAMLDRAFFDLCSSIPAAQLYSCGRAGTDYCGKLPLKRLLARQMGNDFAFRPKQGFMLPLDAWFATDPGSHQVRDCLLPSTAHISAWFRPDAVKDLVREGNSTNTWLLLVLEEWLAQVKRARRQSCPMPDPSLKGHLARNIFPS